MFVLKTNTLQLGTIGRAARASGSLRAVWVKNFEMVEMKSPQTHATAVVLLPVPSEICLRRESANSCNSRPQVVLTEK